MTNMNIKDNAVAVATDYYWLPMCDCPRAVKVQLLGRGGVATHGHYDGKDTFWEGWTPLPNKRKPDSAKPIEFPEIEAETQSGITFINGDMVMAGDTWSTFSASDPVKVTKVLPDGTINGTFRDGFNCIWTSNGRFAVNFKSTYDLYELISRK